jgi:hypothetical protein
VDVRINEVNSQVQTVDSKALLDPQVMRQIVNACMNAIKENEDRKKILDNDRELTDGASSNDK